MTTTTPTQAYGTSNAAGLFSSTTEGDVQGTYYDDPAVRWALRYGILDPSETLPMWGGILIYARVPTTGVTNPNNNFGQTVGRATTQTQTGTTGAAGFSVFNQNYAAIIDPGTSNVPLSGTYNEVLWFPFGSGAEIAVKCDPSLASLEGGSIFQQVSWDFTNQLLQPYDASTGTIAASSTVTWASTGGGQLTFPVANWSGAWEPIAGDTLTISGATNTGTGGAAAINTSFTVVSATGTQAILAAPAASGVFGTIAGSPVLNFGTGALPVKVMRFSTGNSMTVTWNGATANWNPTGTTCVIKI